ncbi:MAG TPA: hypothetical protein DCR14_15600 [Acidimicrobiaceae bacterium]|nr:hypothetical protein [Acidimicrobiaceae bacterium]
MKAGAHHTIKRFDPMNGTWAMVFFDLVIVVGLVSTAKAVTDRIENDAARWGWFIALSAVLIFALVAVPLRVMLLRQRHLMVSAANQARRAAATDALTGLPNRRTTDEIVQALLADGVPFAVAICDLDHFKHLNDGFGHDAGDKALRVFAHTLRSVVRHGDVVSRHGGEEFIVILPRAQKCHGADVLERARLELAVVLSDRPCPAYTFSAGVADTSETSEWRHLLELADQRLLHAKRLGRDRVLASIA